MQLSTKTLLALVPYFLQVQAGASGTGTTTRYWDCCKPSCAWSGKTALASGASPVGTCDISNNPLTDPYAASGCEGGSAYMCSNESPWAVTDDLAYGYAAVNIAGGSEDSWCCACYELTFTSGAVAGKKMIVQATNTGGDLGSNQFDISMPGGGVGIFNGCTTEWGAPSSGWGAQYGGISDRSDCDSFPEALQAGCYWRFDWFEGTDNPTVSFKQVSCPAALTANTGCTRADDSSEPAAAAPSGSTIAAAAPIASTSAAPVVASSPVAVADPVATSSAVEAGVVGPSAGPVASTTPVAEPVASTTPIAEPVASTTPIAEPVISTAPAADPATTTPLADPTPVSSADPVSTSDDSDDDDDDDVCEL